MDLCTRHFLRQRLLCYGGISVSGHMGIPIFCYSLFTETFSWKSMHGKWEMFNPKIFERQMCSGFQAPACLSICLSFTFVFSLYSTSIDTTIHLENDLPQGDVMQVNSYQRFGRTWCFFSKQQVTTKHCYLWNRVHGVTQDETHPDTQIFRNLKAHNPAT